MIDLGSENLRADRGRPFKPAPIVVDGFHHRNIGITNS